MEKVVPCLWTKKNEKKRYTKTCITTEHTNSWLKICFYYGITVYLWWTKSLIFSIERTHTFPIEFIVSTKKELYNLFPCANNAIHEVIPNKRTKKKKDYSILICDYYSWMIHIHNIHVYIYGFLCKVETIQR